MTRTPRRAAVVSCRTRGRGTNTLLTGRHTLSSNFGNTRRLGTLPPGRDLAGGDEAGPRKPGPTRCDSKKLVVQSRRRPKGSAAFCMVLRNSSPRQHWLGEIDTPGPPVLSLLNNASSKTVSGEMASRGCFYDRGGFRTHDLRIKSHLICHAP